MPSNYFHHDVKGSLACTPLTSFRKTGPAQNLPNGAPPIFIWLQRFMYAVKQFPCRWGPRPIPSYVVLGQGPCHAAALQALHELGEQQQSIALHLVKLTLTQLPATLGSNSTIYFLRKRVLKRVKEAVPGPVPKGPSEFHGLPCWSDQRSCWQ